MPRVAFQHVEASTSRSLVLAIHRPDASPGEPDALRSEITLGRNESAVLDLPVGTMITVCEA